MWTVVQGSVIVIDPTHFKEKSKKNRDPRSSVTAWPGPIKFGVSDTRLNIGSYTHILNLIWIGWGAPYLVSIPFYVEFRVFLFFPFLFIWHAHTDHALTRPIDRSLWLTQWSDSIHPFSVLFLSITPSDFCCFSAMIAYNTSLNAFGLFVCFNIWCHQTYFW